MATNQPQRTVIYASDVRRITGCSRPTSYRQLMKVKKALGKKQWQYISIEEYCNYYQLDYQKALKLIF